MSVYERRDLSGNMFGRGFDSRRLHFRKVEKNKKELKPYKIKVLALFISIRKGKKWVLMQNFLH